MKVWRLISSGFCSASQNMAYDEALLINYKRINKPSLRIYGFSSLSFSLGYFQNPLEILNWQECKRRNVFFVRRPTGGGLIPHKTELTYSIVCSRFDLGLKNNFKENLIKSLSLFIFKLYDKLGFKPRYPKNLKKNSKERKSWLCLLNLEPFDILVKEKKIGGFAQRRRKDLILQQGIILLNLEFGEISSLLKKEVKDIVRSCIGLKELLKREVSFEELSFFLKDSFQETLDCKLQESYFNKEEIELSKVLIRKYESREWNFHRKLPSNFPEKAFLA